MLNIDFLSVRSCFEAFTENMSGESQLLEQRRVYHCAAYNCAIAAISCSFSEPKFFNGFLFSEKPEKVQKHRLFKICQITISSKLGDCKSGFNLEIIFIPFSESVDSRKYH